jgi:hypothetical protein
MEEDGRVAFVALKRRTDGNDLLVRFLPETGDVLIVVDLGYHGLYGTPQGVVRGKRFADSTPDSPVITIYDVDAGAVLWTLPAGKILRAMTRYGWVVVDPEEETSEEHTVTKTDTTWVREVEGTVWATGSMVDEEHVAVMATLARSENTYEWDLVGVPGCADEVQYQWEYRGCLPRDSYTRLAVINWRTGEKVHVLDLAEDGAPDPICTNREDGVLMRIGTACYHISAAYGILKVCDIPEDLFGSVECFGII